jgi:hypothetical protein
LELVRETPEIRSPEPPKKEVKSGIKHEILPLYPNRLLLIITILISIVGGFHQREKVIKNTYLLEYYPCPARAASKRSSCPPLPAAESPSGGV